MYCCNRCRAFGEVLTFGDEDLCMECSQDEVNDLVNRNRILIALENAGVDNWIGYDGAIDGYKRDWSMDG